MGFAPVLRSEFFRARRMRISLVLSCLYLGIALLYVFAGSGAWVSAGDEGVFAGFSADPSYLELLNLRCGVAECLVSAALAHTVLLPITVVLIVGMFFNAPREDAVTFISHAHGIGDGTFFLARTLVCSTYLAITYTFFSSLILGIHVLLYSPADDSFVSLFLQRIMLSNLLNTSFVVLCSMTFVAFHVRALTSGGLLVLTYAGLIVAMSSPNTDIPVHMAYWIQLCGVPVSDCASHTVMFSLISIMLCALVTSVCLWFRREYR